jgi:hypothetical protein
LFCVSHQGKGSNDQISLIVFSLSPQIKNPAPVKNSLSAEAAGNCCSHISQISLQILRQTILQPSDRYLQFLEGDIAYRQAGNRHPLAQRRLQVVLEMEKQINTWQASDPTGANQSDQADGK